MILDGILLIVLSLVAVPSLFLDKNPKAKELAQKILPYQAWAGVVFCFWGVWEIIHCLLNLNYLGLGLGWVIGWVTLFLVGFVEIFLGFILGYGLIVQYVFSKKEETKEKGEKMLAKMLPLQGKVAILGLIVGLWLIVVSFIWLA